MADDNDLSEEKILELLQNAEQRLKLSQQNGQSLIQSTSLSSLQKSIANGTPEQTPSYLTSTGQGFHLNSAQVARPEERKLANGIRRVDEPVKVSSSKDKKADAGPAHFNMPRTVVTPELKRDLQLLKMRAVLDPKRFYKKENAKAQIPEFSQVGTVIEGPTEYFSARLSNKDRKRTFVEEVLAGEKDNKRFKSKYGEIVASKSSGKKAHYKKLKEMRRGGSSKG
ncbi:hypothetical protein PVAG01_02571 [Phlyctema vagabunda]|uniref:Fcf2 pre-rRNA processing C-terminal domain-containing protein n=1 Tax=Phlyctema vagabunda TaxID=108571 RepID=A0ABR4PR77_9HELO